MAFSLRSSILQLLDLASGHVFDGLLFIGDPHVYSGTPGRRLDACFHQTVCNKLTQAGHLCTARNLYPILLGDLLHKDNDEDARMLLALVRALQTFPFPPLTIVGNHDMKGEALTDANPLRLLGETGLLRLLDRSGFQGFVQVVGKEGGTEKVAIGGSPYGAMLPTDMAMAFNASSHDEVARQLGVSTTVWLTHEDLAFEGAYPGSLPLFEMGGIDMVVNGHMHGTKKPVKQGRTAWYNPGNITRLALDMANHRPCVWEWSPARDTGMPSVSGETVPLLLGHELTHTQAAEIFDFTGTQAKTTLRMATAQAPTDISLHFVEALRGDASERRTDEAVFLMETLQPLLTESKAPESAKTRILSLLDKARAAVATS